ncbi:uncharacterized protein LOC143361991 [Halictus rubicundus]|uniref:uncharacterized protein LOC143361991 n=1 Tax=Halictus rubicundus TaxID=77578 RepID=UPI0040365AB8
MESMEIILNSFYKLRTVGFRADKKNNDFPTIYNTALLTWITWSIQYDLDYRYLMLAEVYEVESIATETGGTPEPRPFFEDSESNITVQLGANVYMHCRVQNLQNTLKVSWVRRRGEELHLLTIGLDTYANDMRFSLELEQPNDWRLLLHSATERDGGLYECQVSAHPPLIRTVHLTVSGE